MRLPTFAGKLKLNSPIRVVVDDWDLKGHLITDLHFAGKIDPVQNTS